jgi:serine-type D-Ala-D-Ala carboxypeptidase/endopeptidase (penicillin-binding protein 4)
MKLLFILLFPVLAHSSAMDHATVSFYAVDMLTGEVLADENSDKSLLPASCMKLVTTAAAFELLGPETTFKTMLSYDGYIDEEGTLYGNLYVVGGGDPCLGSDRIEGALGAKEQVALWTAKVKEKGIKKIMGSLIGDSSFWEEELAGSGWLWEDLGNYYGAGASALSFHENMYFLTFKPGEKEGDPTEVFAISPQMPRLSLKNAVKTGALGSGDRAVIYGSELSFEQCVRGTIPMGKELFSIKGAMPNPSLVVEDLLEASLKEEGVLVLGQKISPQKREEIHETVSPTVSEIIYKTNQLSQNLYAEHLLKAMGEGRTSLGRKAASKFLSSLGVALDGFYMDDGSGLSRKNLATTKQLVGVLKGMKQSEFFSEFLLSLPEYKGGIRAKSGSISGVKGYAGYAGDIAFAILINNCSSRTEMNAAVEQFFNELQEH